MGGYTGLETMVSGFNVAVTVVDTDDDFVLLTDIQGLEDFKQFIIHGRKKKHPLFSRC